MEFEIVFYRDNNGRNPIEDFISELAKKNRVLVAKTQKGIEQLRNSAYHAEPLSKHIGQGLWELRIRSKTDILRIFYTFTKGKIIILLHVFIKKQQKTSGRELEIARKRLREIKLREVN